MARATDKIAVIKHEIKIGGAKASADLLRDLIDVVVDTDLHQPNMIVLRFNDKVDPRSSKAKWADNSLFEVGKELEFAISGTSDDSVQTIFKGEITAIEPEFDETSLATLCVRGYDKSHRLHLGRQTRAFLKQTDSAVAQKVAKECGVSVDADATSETFPYIIQHNQTNMEFLRARAERIGYKVYFADGKVCFKKAAPASSSAVAELVWGKDLLSFRPRVSAAHQPGKVKAQGWDPVKKEMITGEAPAPSASNQGGITKTSAATAGAFSAGDEVVTHRFIASVADAKQIAISRSAMLRANYVQAEGTCLGNPKIMAGKVIDVKGIGKNFSGKYYVTVARHRYVAAKNYHYTVDVYITGYEPATISHLLNGYSAENQHLPSAVVGIVTNNKDPDKMGRVKVKFPWLSAEVESQWARLASPMAGPERGLEIIPEVNDEVLVTFEHGDFNSPFILGSLWNGKDKMPVPNDKAVGGDGKVNQRMFKSRVGHVLLFDDTQGDEKITIKDKTGKNEITITSKDNTLTIKTDNKFTINIGQGGVNLESKGPINIKSTSGDIKMEGMNISLKAKTNCTIEGTAGVTVKDGAGAQVALSGPTVNINNGALEIM